MLPLKEYIIGVTFKHLPSWEKRVTIKAKSPKKAIDAVYHMYKNDAIKDVRIIKTPKSCGGFNYEYKQN